MVPEPELEHHQRPEPVPMFAAALDVLGDEASHAVGAEQAAVESRSVEQDGLELVFELGLKPAADGDAVAILRRVLIGLGKRSAKARLSTTLDRPGRNIELAVQGHRRGQLDNTVVQERSPAFEAMARCSPGQL